MLGLGGLAGHVTNGIGFQISKQSGADWAFNLWSYCVYAAKMGRFVSTCLFVN